MNGTNVTVVGHVATEPRLRDVEGGSKVTNFRLATNERRFDRALQQWRDGATMFFGVSCWRGLAENVFGSVTKGQPVIVTGKLQISSYADKDGVPRTSVEINAATVGHDLSRGISSFTKADLTARHEREVAAELAREMDDEHMPAFDAATGRLLETNAREHRPRLVETDLAG